MTEPAQPGTRPERPVHDATQPDLPVPLVTAAPTPLSMSAFATVSRAGVYAARAFGNAVSPDLLAAVAADLTRDLGVAVSLTVDAVRSFEHAVAFASPGCYAWLEVGPGAAPWLLDIDLRLALALGAMLSGAPAVATPLLRELSPVERAAIGYLCLRALDRCAGPETSARLLGIFAAPPASASDMPFVRVDARLSAGEVHGRIALLVPRAALASSTEVGARNATLPGHLAGARCELGVELGHAVLLGADLAALAVGDVVVCGRPEHGEALLRFAGARRGFAVTLEHHSASTALHLAALVHAPEVPTMSEPALTGAALLADASLPATVELGRITLPAEELAALKAGDTLLLGRTLSQPLDLVVGGKVLARGELVDVEGELGFRVTSLR